MIAVAESVVFEVNCDATRVYLRIDSVQGSPVMLPLRGVGQGHWRLDVNLLPGTYRFRYYAAEGESLTYYAPPADQGMDGLDAVLTVEPATIA